MDFCCFKIVFVVFPGNVQLAMTERRRLTRAGVRRSALLLAVAGALVLVAVAIIVVFHSKPDDPPFAASMGSFSPWSQSFSREIQLDGPVIHRFDTKGATSDVAVLAREASPRRQNVLFIVSDDLRAQLGAYGRSVSTPSLDALAARGVVFDRAYAQVTVCNPSRVSFMTGRRPDVAKIWHFEHVGPGDWSSIPRVFGDHGFTSLGVGKLWHLPTGPGGPDSQFPDTRNVTGVKYFPTSTEFQPMLVNERNHQNATVGTRSSTL